MLEELTALKPDIAILSCSIYDMPTENLVSKIRELHLTPIPVIMTLSSSPEMMRTMILAGVRHFLAIPSSTNHLISVIRDAYAHGQKVREYMSK